MAQSNEDFLLLNHLLDNLHIEQLDTYLFKGQTKVHQLSRVFGGQVLAQAVNAASRTVDSTRPLHSLHSYFLRPGNPKKDIIYDVDPIRDGGSFTTRRVVAKQDGKAIFNASLSFQRMEKGFEHQMDMPSHIPSPDNLQSEKDFWHNGNTLHPDCSPADIGQFQALDMRVVNRQAPNSLGNDEPIHGMWIKTSQPLTDNIALHQKLLAYVSDMMLMGTALRPHPIHFRSKGFQGASLDHSMWFHCDFRLDDWLYYHMDSPRSAGARGFNRGSFYTKEGILIASTAQEGLMRVK